MTNHVGQQLGNYRLIQLLGRGGFADVYLGEHVYLKTQAAIKILHTQLEGKDLKDFLQEAQIIARLRHSNIVRILDFGVDSAENTPYLVMDLAPNGTLRQRHPKGSVVPLATIVSYVKQVAAALQYAHDEKLIHCDVKPENMLLGNNNEVLLSDFGIAAVAHSTSSLKTQEYIGTIHYSAPEQINGKPLPASDQYALGIVVYEWLTGSRPFYGSRLLDIAMQHLNSTPPLLREKVSTISLAVEQVVMKALEKDPKKRFSSVQDFASALEEAYQPKPGTLLFRYHGHSSELRSLAWSPDGQYIASASLDKTVQVWEAITGQQVFTWDGAPTRSGQATPYVVAWAPDGKQIAVGTGGRGVYIYDTVTGKELSQYDRGWGFHGSDVQAMAWSPDGKYIASGIDDDWAGSRSTVIVHGLKRVHVWEVATQHKLSTCWWISSKPAIAIAWLRDGKQIGIVAGDENSRPEVTLCDATTGQRVLSYYGPSSEDDDPWNSNQVAWSPDKTRIASAIDSTVHIWNADTGETLLVHHGTPGASVMSVAWSPDGTYIASGDTGNTVQVWEAATGGIVVTYNGHANAINAVAWSPDGARIASASDDRTVHVWQAI